MGDDVRQHGDDIFIKYIRDVMFGTRTCTPAIVKAVETDGEGLPIYVTVQPLLQEALNLKGAKPKDLPEIDRVPVWMPRTRKAVLNIPIEVGDIVALLVADHSLDNWLQSNEGDVVDHQDTRDHELTDAIAFPGFYPHTFPDPAQPVQTDFGLNRQIGEAPTDLVRMVIEADGNVKISTSHTVNVSGGVVNVGAGEVNIGAGKNPLGGGGDINEVAEGDFTQSAEGDMSITAEGDVLVNADGLVNLGGDSGESALKGETVCGFMDEHIHVCPILGFSGIPKDLTVTEPGLKSAKVKVDG